MVSKTVALNKRISHMAISADNNGVITMAYSSYLSTNGSSRNIRIAMVALLHISAVVAIKNGLDITSVHSTEPPLITRVINVQPKSDPLPPMDASGSGKSTVKITPSEPTIDIANNQTNSTTATTREETKPTEGAGLTTTAARIDAKHPLTQPPYPPQSRRLGEQGRVELLVYVLPSGKIGEARIARSSGFQRLDNAAVKEAMSSWRLLPNEENGVPVGAWVTLAITFRLTQ
jgi:protein TonB